MDDLFPSCRSCSSEAEGYFCRLCAAPLCEVCAEEDGCCERCGVLAGEYDPFADESDDV